MNTKLTWKKLIVKDGMTVPTEENLATAGTKNHREYFIKQSRSSVRYFEKAAKGSEDPGAVIGNTFAGMFAGIDEMVRGIEQGAASATSSPLQPLDELTQPPKDGVKKEVTPFELVGRLFGSLAAASARAEQQQTATNSADTATTQQNGASNSESNQQPPRVECTQQ